MGKIIKFSQTKVRVYLDLHFLFSEALHSLWDWSFFSPLTLALEVCLTFFLSVDWLMI